jgi:uncharacterized SAM-binding protein YcdF (DUF218 family)
MSEAPVKSKNDLKKKTGIVLLVIVLICLLAYSLRTPLLTGLANYLISTDVPLEKADMIFVLNGDYDTRPFYSSDLYEQGLAPIVAIAQTESSPSELLGLVDNPTDIAVEVMKLRGVPAEKLVVLNNSGPVTSTFDEARTLRQYVETHNIRSVIMVTSAFHTRRSRWIFERELAGVQVKLEVAGAPYINFDASNWWQYENGLINLNNEYIKLIFYKIKYH